MNAVESRASNYSFLSFHLSNKLSLQADLPVLKFTRVPMQRLLPSELSMKTLWMVLQLKGCLLENTLIFLISCLWF
jgi:hypothetical protein